MTAPPAGRILVFGASSFVGRDLVPKLGAGRTVPTFLNRPVRGGVRFDARTMSLADITSDLQDITHAVLLLGDTQPDSCFADPVRSNALNVEAINQLIDQLVERGIKLIFTSSEFVFDGKKGNYAEIDEPAPVLLYGKQKLAVEHHLAAATPDHVILRLAKIYDLSPSSGTLFAGMLNAVRTNANMRCAADQRFSPVYVGDVSNAIITAAENSFSGTYHLGGPAGLTRMQFLEMLIDEASNYIELDVEIEPCSIHDFDLPEPRPVDVSLNPNKLVVKFGLDLLEPHEACRRICATALVSQ